MLDSPLLPVHSPSSTVLFNSYIFILVFLPLVVIGFFLFSHFKLFQLSIAWLTVASLFFYGYWNIYYLPLLLFSITFNYLLGRNIEAQTTKSKKSQGLLFLGILVNLGLLGYYKYTNFFLNSLNQGLNFQFNLAQVILPLAISFYTFTQIAFLVDAYYGKTKNCQYNFLSYSFFVSFFPQLIAGPILRYNELLPQLKDKSIFAFSQKNFTMGVTLFILGLSKKVLVADNLSPWVNGVFSNPFDSTFLEAWVGTIAYTFQLYFDFSGYSDMAIGLAWMFNLQLPINFNSPYKATSIIDFWRRWHITLSHFLRDYLYIPLGGNRQGKIRQYINLLITMLLGGLWHGAGWNFVVWGGLHGVFLVVNNVGNKFNITMTKLVSWLLTFLIVVLSWVIFRAPNLQEGFILLKTMLGLNGLVLPTAYQSFIPSISSDWITFQSWLDFQYLPAIGLHKTILILFVILIIVTQSPNTQEIMNSFQPKRWFAYTISLLAVLCLLSLNQVSEFLYFQF
ncbi:MBOAT family protein [Spirulina sp. CS-785/01]|uniref:MBOAT family O-acyltransferase n=1 Tax=Spirulina sp. CS-785/01 TaxID=3021716 RepID=UPI00232BABEB|nr:MBOAT family protein [Spirulina sp. CS-785/01]MDB9312791.1 MBOAT family protein [Spirulina sp. CS-785/01]